MRHLTTWLLATPAALLAGTVPAVARHQIGAIGPSGDRQTVLLCGPGEQLRGFRGRSGTWIDQIQVMCARRGPNGQFNPPAPRGIVAGGAGGADQSEWCDVSQPMTSFVAYRTQDLKRIAEIAWSCGGPKNFGNGSYSGTNNVVAQFINADCSPYGEAMVGIVVNYGKDVNGLGYVCDKVP